MQRNLKLIPEDFEGEDTGRTIYPRFRARLRRRQEKELASADKIGSTASAHAQQDVYASSKADLGRHRNEKYKTWENLVDAALLNRDMHDKLCGFSRKDAIEIFMSTAEANGGLQLIKDAFEPSVSLHSMILVIELETNDERT